MYGGLKIFDVGVRPTGFRNNLYLQETTLTDALSETTADRCVEEAKWIFSSVIWNEMVCFAAHAWHCFPISHVVNLEQKIVSANTRSYDLNKVILEL